MKHSFSLTVIRILLRTSAIACTFATLSIRWKKNIINASQELSSRHDKRVKSQIKIGETISVKWYYAWSMNLPNVNSISSNTNLQYYEASTKHSQKVFRFFILNNSNLKTKSKMFGFCHIWNSYFLPSEVLTVPPLPSPRLWRLSFLTKCLKLFFDNGQFLQDKSQWKLR